MQKDSDTGAGQRQKRVIYDNNSLFYFYKPFNILPYLQNMQKIIDYTNNFLIISIYTIIISYYNILLYTKI